MKKYFSTSLQFIFSLGIGLGIVYFTFGKLSDDDLKIMKDAFLNANYFWLFFGVFFNLLSNYFRTERWRMLLRPLGYNPGFFNTYFSVIVMYFANLLFPRLGEVMRCGILHKYEKIPVNKSIGTMVTERLVDLLTLPLIMLILLVFEKDKFTSSLATTQSIVAKFGNNPIYSYTLYIILALVVAYVGYKLWIDKSWWAKIQHFFKGLFEGFKSILNTGNPALFLFHSLAIWFCYFLNGYVSFYALPETAQLGGGAALGALFFGAFAYTAVQGGVGAYPLVLAKFLLVYGIAENIGFSFGWLVWTVQTVMVILGGLFSFVILAFINKTSNESIASHSA